MYFEEFKLGMTFALKSVKITKEQILSFARDYDPQHIHLEEREDSVFGGLIAPGVMSFMLLWAEFIRMDILGREMVAGLNTKIEWLAPVFAGDELTGKARVTALKPRNGKNGLLEITFDIFNQAGERVVKDVTQAIVKRAGAQ